MQVKNLLLGSTDIGRTFDEPIAQSVHINPEAATKFSVNNVEYFDLLTKALPINPNSAPAENTRIISAAQANRAHFQTVESDDGNWSAASTIPSEAIREAIRQCEENDDTDVIPHCPTLPMKRHLSKLESGDSDLAIPKVEENSESSVSDGDSSFELPPMFKCERR